MCNSPIWLVASPALPQGHHFVSQGLILLFSTVWCSIPHPTRISITSKSTYSLRCYICLRRFIGHRKNFSMLQSLNKYQFVHFKIKNQNLLPRCATLLSNGCPLFRLSPGLTSQPLSRSEVSSRPPHPGLVEARDRFAPPVTENSSPKEDWPHIWKTTTWVQRFTLTLF